MRRLLGFLTETGYPRVLELIGLVALGGLLWAVIYLGYAIG